MHKMLCLHSRCPSVQNCRNQICFCQIHPISSSFAQSVLHGTKRGMNVPNCSFPSCCPSRSSCCPPFPFDRPRHRVWVCRATGHGVPNRDDVAVRGGRVHPVRCRLWASRLSSKVGDNSIHPVFTWAERFRTAPVSLRFVWISAVCFERRIWTEFGNHEDQ